MSIANENIQSNLDGNEYFVNDNENVNDTDSGKTKKYIEKYTQFPNKFTKK